MTIIYSRTRLKVTYSGDGNPGPNRVGWGPIPMLPVPHPVARLAASRVRRTAMQERAQRDLRGLE